MDTGGALGPSRTGGWPKEEGRNGTNGMSMHRRSFLTRLVLGGLAFLVRKNWLLGAELSKGLIRRIRPSDAAWPNAGEWQKLNAAVGGKLIKVQALFAGCQGDRKSATCVEALENMHNPFWLADQPAGTETSGWFDAWTPAPSAYAVAARNATDVAAGVNFAREHKLRLVVKGGAHSYQGTSNYAD